jgi:ATP/maltotriose-dependent transcriptional regulator MalT
MNDAESEVNGYGQLVRAKIVNSGVSLSERERLIVLLMARELSDKAIARQMSIAPETVSSHAKRIFLKLSVQTRAQAVFRATTLGLI